MELYQVAYFVEVARQRGFTRAAERLRIAQPALSQQIRKLEEELGTALLIRGRRESVLTAAGEAFLTQAEALLAMAETAKQTVAEVAQLKRGRLVIATVPTLSACWLPEVIRRFRERYPRIELTLREESSEVVAEWVELRTAEIGFLQLPVEGNLFRVREVIREPFVVVVPSGHPLAERQQVRLGELAREAFVFYKGRVKSVALDACRLAGFSPRVVCETGELETVRALVRAGLGIALLPQLAVQEPDAGLRTLKLQGRRLERRLGLIGRQDAKWSAAAKAFVDCMDTVLRTGRPHPDKALPDVVGEKPPGRGGSGKAAR